MNIYLYGSSKFKKSMLDVLAKANLSDVTKEINDVDELDVIISNNPHDIYLIDSDKIINRNIITDKLKFLKPQGAVYKEYLDELGIDDMCFNSNEALVNYIIDKINSSDFIDHDDSNDVDIELENDEIQNDNIIKERNMDDIMEIDDIFESEMADALGANIEDLKLNEKTLSTPQKKEVEAVTNDISNNEIDTVKSNNVQIDTSNVNDVMSLIQELLKNKTLELSIKIKD